MINEYNNPNLMVCMFPTLFPFGIDALQMNDIPIKVSLQTHVKHLITLDKTHYQFPKFNLFPLFVFNIMQRKQI